MRRTLECTGVFKTRDFFKVKNESRTSQERAKKILWRQLVMDVHVNILAFLLIFVTLQSPPPDENQYHL